MNTKIIKNILAIVGIILVSALLYAATIHGVWGNPTVADFKDNLDQATKPFELSPERGRFAHVFELAEHQTFALDDAWAAVAYPDVGLINGQKFSFFAPGVSYYSTPFYIVGRTFNLGQVFVFAAIAFASIMSFVFIYLLGREAFELPISASLLAVLFFGFGSTAWSYAVTLYQHHISVFLIVSGVYAVWRFSKASRFAFLWALYVGLAYGLSIMVDYPNVILMLPVMVYLAYSAVSLKESNEHYKISFRASALVALISFVLITGVHFYHNQVYYGSWHQLAGGIPNYTPTPEVKVPLGALPTVHDAEDEKQVVGFFKEEHIPTSIFVLLFSPDRGLFLYWPIAFLSLIGIFIFRKKIKPVHYAMIALMLCNLFLYGSWGDPWGGWAYGPRYLILSLPWLALFSVAAVYYGKQVILQRVGAFILFAYGAAIALLGVLTTNAVPPKSEAILLPLKKYGFFYNISFFKDGRSSSFIYNSFAFHSMTLGSYFLMIYAVLILTASILLVVMPIKNHD